MSAGAVTRITCLAVHDYDQEGCETASFSVKSKASDAEGYFYSTINGNSRIARLTLITLHWRLAMFQLMLIMSFLVTYSLLTVSATLNYSRSDLYSILALQNLYRQFPVAIN